MASVLLVDPNVAFRRMMEQLLRQQGHEVLGADDAEHAGLAMKERAFELVIVELVLGGEMSGTEFLEWLRDFPASGDPARVALCSLGSFAQQEGYLRAELALDGFIVKPFKPGDLSKSVKAALDARAKRPRTEDLRAAGFAPPPAAPPAAPAVIVPAPPPEQETLASAPAPSAAEFEDASGADAISLEELAPEPASAERRATPRYPVRLPVKLHDGKQPFRARAENLGRGGAFITTDHPLAVGSPIKIRLDEIPVPGTGYNEISATVVFQGNEGDNAGYGLQFGEMSAETARRLDAFLEQLRQPAERPFLVVASATLAAEVEQIAQSFRNEEIRVRLVRVKDDIASTVVEEPPDLVLLDLAVPLVSQAVQTLKSDRSTSRIPVGLIDRTKQAQVALIAAAAGGDRFFVLPDDSQRLVKFAVDQLAAGRRRSVRVRFQRPLTVVAEGAQLPAIGIDLSETGLQCGMAAGPRENTACTIVLPLSDGGAPARFASRIAWVEPTQGGVRIGIVFEPDEETRARLRTEVRKALAVGYYVRWLGAAPKTKPPSGAHPVAVK